jgi:hypothetical protein
MPAIADLFPSRFISAADIAKMKDKTTPFVIKNVVAEDCINPKTKKPEQKWIVYFQGGVKKGHRIRKTEVQKLATSLGATTEEWQGKSVTFRAVSTPTGAGVRMIPVAKPGEDLNIDENAIPDA